MTYKFSTVIEKDKFGYYAYCPELKGCHTQGETLEEVNFNIREAIELYLETMSEDEISDVISSEVMTGIYEVKVG
ncbi:MAG: type II toxin-antitoxin system HicB family antitoxin [Ignavibacteria bacterium]